MQHILRRTAVIGLSVGLAAALAGPAAAASQTASWDCSSSNNGVPITLTVGETLTISTSGACDRTDFPLGVGTVTFGPSGTGTSVTVGSFASIGSGNKVVYTATAAGSAIVTVSYFNGGVATNERSWIITVTEPVAMAPVTVTQAPAPVIQQFGRPAVGTCDDAQPSALNWAGVPSGGWGHSWAQWMNSGLGGAVCTRLLTYDASLAKWVVN